MFGAPMWHKFVREPEDPNTSCEVCGVVVEHQIVESITLGCPVRLCKDPSNHDEPCVFVATDDGPECAYCGRYGDPDARDETPDDDDGDALLLMMPWVPDSITGLDLR